MNADIFGYLATALNLVMLFPQVIKTWRTKQTKGLSFSTPLIFAIACFLWVIYGIIKSAPPVIIANIVCGLLNLILVLLKLKY